MLLFSNNPIPLQNKVRLATHTRYPSECIYIRQVKIIWQTRNESDICYLTIPYIPGFNFWAESSTNKNIRLRKVKLQCADPKFIVAAKYLCP